ncbi:MAG: toll/interleukin-1 receptor domain-containing protein [Pseudomonadota bacterium]
MRRILLNSGFTGKGVVRIFISYASSDRAIAEELYHALVQQGHRVFIDSIDLRAGDAYHAELKAQVASADRMLVLISDAALDPSRYTLTELGYAQERWPDPTGRVLPIAISDYDPSRLPPYLRSITVLEPKGNAIAAVLHALAGDGGRRHGLLTAALGVLLAGVVMGGAYLLRTPSTPAEAPLRFLRVALDAENAYWEEIPRDRPNYYYERGLAMAGDDPELAADLEARKAEGAYVCPALFTHPDRCRQAARFFAQKDLQNEAIDPSFDILLSNHTGEALVILSLGVEIEFAAQITVSLGDWETTRVKIDEQYEIAMPAHPPSDSFRVGDTVVDASDALSDFVQTFGRYPSPSTLRSVIGALDYEWTGLPIVETTALGDPVYLQPDEPYRFGVVLTSYKSMPSNVVLRFRVETDRGEFWSEYYYLFAL